MHLYYSFIPDCSTSDQNVTLSFELIAALTASLIAAVGIGLILTVVMMCIYCLHIHTKRQKCTELS